MPRKSPSQRRISANDLSSTMPTTRVIRWRVSERNCSDIAQLGRLRFAEEGSAMWLAQPRLPSARGSG